MNLLIRWIFTVIAVIVSGLASSYLGLTFKVVYANGSQVFALFVGVAILAILNATLGKILKLVTAPLACLTFGLFSLVVNAVVLLLASLLTDSFQFSGTFVQNLLAAIVVSILISAITGFLTKAFLKAEGD